MEALMIGVSGMRGTVGGTLTPPVISRMAGAFATWLMENERPHNGSHFHVVFGRDSRPSGTWVRDAATSILTACGIEVTDLDVVTTPGVAMMVKHLNADAGMVATASHNPIQWNGLKFLNREALALPSKHAERLKQLYDSAALPEYVRVEKVVPLHRNTQTHALHIKRVLERVDVLGISSKKYKVVVDSVNGAGCISSATMLGKLGCRLVHINATPDGRFPHEPEPTAQNLTQLADEVKRQHAAVGFAQDPDADRLAIVDENGTYIGEEYSLALAAKLILGKKPGGVAVANLSTSRMIDDVAQQHQGKVIRTPVGEANVVQSILAYNAVIGGEGNGGVIYPRINFARDSLVGMALVLHLLAETGKSVTDLVNSFPSYHLIKEKLVCPSNKISAVLRMLRSEYAAYPVDLRDGVKVSLPDGWFLVRGSNTEPIVRVIAEARNEASARDVVTEIFGKVQACINS